MPESRVRKSVDDKRKRVETAKTTAKNPAKTSSSPAKAAATSATKAPSASAASTSKTAKTAEKSADASAGKTATATKTASKTASRVSRRIAEDSQPTSRRWLLPAAIVLAVLGAVWGAAYFVTYKGIDKLIPGQHGLGKWNILIAVGAIVVAAIGYLVLKPRTGTPYAAGSRRWVPPTFIAVGLLGVAWLIVYYVAGTSIPIMSTLGNWNILIGMAGMAGAFVIATLWK